ncbi:MAG: sulfotransferase [Phycisphaeraceae bacterium]|nr:sulfotransferase [Phycisphaeraceae bacterium]
MSRNHSRTSPRIEVGVSERTGVAHVMPVFFAAVGGAEISLLAGLLDIHPEIDAHPFALLLHSGAGGVASAREALRDMLAESSRDAAMRVRNGLADRVRHVGAQVDLSDMESADCLAAAFPGAPLVCVLRDGRRAIVAERCEHLARAGQPWRWGAGGKRGHSPSLLFDEAALRTAVVRWAASLRGAHRAAELLGDRVMILREDELTTDTARAFGRVCRWLGVSSEQGRLLAAVQAARARQTERPIAPDWREALSESDKAAFKRIAGELLVELGFESDLSW